MAGRLNNIFRPARILQDLLAAARTDGAIEESVAELFDTPPTLKFVGERTLKFTCSDAIDISFMELDKFSYCTFEANVNGKVHRGDFYGRSYDGISYREIFAFYFDSDPETAQLIDSFLALETAEISAGLDILDKEVARRAN